MHFYLRLRRLPALFSGGTTQVNAFKYESELAGLDGGVSGAVLGDGQRKAAFLEPLRKDAVATPVPKQDTHLVTTAIEEDKQMSTKRVLLEGPLDEC